MSDEINMQELHQMEQMILSSSSQIRSFRSKIIEIDSALKDLESSDKSYKIVGNIMVSSSKDALIEELNSEKEVIQTRISSLEKQEKKLKETLKDKQEEFIKQTESKKTS